jgi:hypothetical protein
MLQSQVSLSLEEYGLCDCYGTVSKAKPFSFRLSALSTLSAG